jgi:hypothetical protein
VSTGKSDLDWRDGEHSNRQPCGDEGAPRTSDSESHSEASE